MTALEAFLAAAALALSAAPPECKSGTDCVSIDNVGAAGIFALADRLAEAERYEEAEGALLALTADSDPEIRAEARFRLGLLRERRGDLRGAEAAWRELLDERPDANRVRLELARILAQSGDDAGARRELRRASAAGLPEDVALAVDRFAGALRSLKRRGASFEIAIAPDTNINRSTRQQTVDTVIAPLELDDAARARSGIGLSLSGQAYSRDTFFGETILTRLSAHGDLYRDGRFSDIGLTLAAGPEWIGRAGRWRPAALFNRRWYGGDHYSDSFGGSLNWLFIPDRKSQIETEITLLERRHEGNRGLDGLIADVSIAHERAISPRLSGKASVRLTRVDARAPSESLMQGSVEILGVRQFPAVTAFVQVGYSKVRGDAPFLLFGRIRDDDRIDVTVGMLLRRWRFHGLMPVARIVQTESDSSIPLYDFRRTRVEFGVSREF